MTQEIAVIRIKGLTKIEAGMKETLERNRLRKKAAKAGDFVKSPAATGSCLQRFD